MPDNLVRNVLQWVTDAASINKTVADANKVGNATAAQAKRAADEFTAARRITAQYDDTLGKLGATASANLTLLEQSMRDGVEETERLRRTTAAAAQEYDELGASAARAGQQASNAAGNSRASGAFETVDQIGSRSSQIFSGLGNSELANSAGLVGDVAASFSTLNPLLIASTAAGAGLAIILGDVQRQLEATRLEGEKYAQQTVSNAELIAGGATSEDVRALIAEQRGPANYITSTLEQLTAFRDELGQYGDVFANLADPARQARIEEISKQIEAVTGRPFDNISQLDSYIAELTTSGNEYQTTILNLNQLLNSGALELNDARAEGERSAEGFRSFVETLRAGLGNVGDAVKDFTKEAVETTAKAVEDIQETAFQRNENYLDLLREETRLREDLVEVQQKAIDIAAKRDSDIEALNQEDADKDIEQERELGERRQEIVAEVGKRIAKAEEEAGRLRDEAVGNRDADAFRQANVRAKTAAKEAEATAKDQADKLQTQYDKQERAEALALSKRTASIQKQAEIAIRLENERARNLEFTVAQTQSSIQFLETNGAASVINIHGQMWTSLQGQAFVQGQNTVLSFANGVQAALGGRAGGGPNSFPTLSSTYGAAMPTTQTQFNKMFDQRYVQVKTAARGGRMIIP